MLHKMLRKAISIILVFAMLCEISTPLAYAAGEAETESGNTAVFEDAVYSKDVAEIINNPSKGEIIKASDETVAYENTDRREANTKSYRLTNGSNALFLFPIEVHEKDAEGEWVEIDNLLKETQNETEEPVFSAKSVNTETELHKAPQTGRFLDLATKNGNITWGLKAENIDVSGSYRGPEVEEGQKKLQIKSLSGVVTYKEVLPGTDIQYQLLGHDIEEAIIVNTLEAAERIATDGISYSLSLGGYRAELKDDQICLYPQESDTPEYVISAAYMEDAALADSGDITVALEEAEDAYTVTICPDSEWLTDPERVFPIVIDPTIAQFSRTKVLDTCSVYSQNPTQNLYNYGNLLVGREASSYQKLRALIRFDLPEAITESDMVIDASLILLQRGYEPTNSPYHVFVDAYRTTANITPSSATWNQLDGHFDTSYVIDNRSTDPSTTGNTSTFDITALVKDWYQNGNNYGITLMSQNETGGYRYVKYYSAHFPGVSQSQLPIVVISFLNQDGLEDYLSYHTAGSDTMGTVSVGDFNGNLIYTYDDISLSGEYMPLSIQHVYNHTKREDADLAGTSMHYGLGFRLNLSQRIESTSITGYPYTHVDADGTSHYFTLKSGTLGAVGSVYEKEMETTTTLEKTSSGYTLDYNGDLKYYFNSSGLLVSIKDMTKGALNQEKELELGYSSGRLTTVTDGAGRVATLTYNSSGYLTKITDPGQREIKFTYSSNRLTQIEEPDGSKIKFNYTAGGDASYMLTKITDIDSSYLSVEYYSNSPCRVKSVTEYGSSGGAGGKLTWTYSGGETVITDRNGHYQTMLFDNTGHTVCIRDDAGNAYFGSYKNTDDNNKHSLSLSSELQGTVTNYLVNHNFDNSTTLWPLAIAGNYSGSRVVETAAAYMGSYGMHCISNSTEGEVGITQTATFDSIAGRTFTLSAWVKINSLSCAPIDLSGVHLELTYVGPNGSNVRHWGECIKQASGQWQRLSYTYTFPSDAGTQIKARIAFASASGDMYIDCVQLEEGAVANRYNMLENGIFRESVGSTSVENWTGEDLSASTDMVAVGRSGNGFTIYGNTDYTKGLVQTVPISGSTGDSYVYSAWGKATAIGPVDKDSGVLRDFGVLIRFVKPSGGSETVKTNFEAKTTGWQYLSGSAVAPCNYTSIQIVLCYYHQKNYAVFDDVQLFKEGFGDVLTYDSRGRVTKSTDCMGRATTYTYVQDRPEIASIVYPDGSTTTYTYDSAHRLLTQTDSNGKTTTYEYDSDGNNKRVKMTASNVTLNSNLKTFSGGYVTQETDPFNNTTSYAYDTSRGLLTSVTEPNSVVTSYAYNANNDLLTGLTKDTSSVSYSYTNRRLTSLTHSGGGNVTYNITYNQFGTRTAVKVGTQNLASYTYASNNGKLTRTTYGNGAYTEPVYDSYDRQIGIKQNGVLKYKWHYGTDGRIGLEEDLANGITWRYLYDRSGNLTSMVGSNGEVVTNTYNSSGKLIGRTVTAGGVTSGSTLTYNSNNKFLNSIAFTNGTLNYTYDDFERASRELEISTGNSLDTDYTFRAGSDANTTSLIPETIRTTGNGWIADYKYTYDSRGNISVVWKKTTTNGSYSQIARYEYDPLNQLVREDNAEANKSYTISYDTGGNITSVKEYAYTTGTLGSATATRNYTYGDSNWKDKLTSYNGTTITYDAIGNPLSYRDGMSFAWQNGRELASVVKNNVTTTYTYDSSGTRNSKTVGGATTWYTLAGGQVQKATTGSNYTLYFYDESGAPISFRTVSGSTTADYYYIKNLQGDVVAICDAARNKVVEYTYDAWGKVLSITGSLASTVGNSNPYRYRGYWFDSETGLYYLQSRYYDPQTGRFVNADDEDLIEAVPNDLTNKNYFTYCDNNPISRSDNGGAFWHYVAGGIIGGIIGGVSAYISGDNVLIGVISGVAGGLLSASGFGKVVQAVGSAVLAAGTNIANSLAKKEKIKWGDVLFDGAVGFVAGLAGGRGASQGNAKGITKEGVNLTKKIKAGKGVAKSLKYYYKTAHRQGGEFVMKALGKSLFKTFCGAAVITTKNRIKYQFDQL